MNNFYSKIEFSPEAKHLMYGNLRSALGYTSTWSVDEVIDFNQIAFDGYVGSLHSVYFPHISVVVNKNSPTWFEMWEAAEDLVSRTKDYQHLFIERFIRQGTSVYMGTGS